MFEPVRSQGNLSEGIVNQIMQAIKRGELKPGDRLPPEREMCSMFSVSRTVIRDALKTLVGLGVVTIRHGMGAFINQIADEQEDMSRLASLLHISKGTVEELFQVREVLESQAVVWCTQNATEHDIQELEKIVERGRKADVRESQLGMLDAEFHLKICEAAGNRVLMRLMINLLDLLGENRARVLMVPGRQRLSVVDHAAVTEAIKERNSDLAREEMLKHLAGVRSAISGVVAEDEQDLTKED